MVATMRLLVDLPVMLPERDGLLLTPDGTEFPVLGEFRLAAWILSGDLSTAEAFRKKLLPPHVPYEKDPLHPSL